MNSSLSLLTRAPFAPRLKKVFKEISVINGPGLAFQGDGCTRTAQAKPFFKQRAGGKVISELSIHLRDWTGWEEFLGRLKSTHSRNLPLFKVEVVQKDSSI